MAEEPPKSPQNARSASEAQPECTRVSKIGSGDINTAANSWRSLTGDRSVVPHLCKAVVRRQHNVISFQQLTKLRYSVRELAGMSIPNPMMIQFSRRFPNITGSITLGFPIF